MMTPPENSNQDAPENKQKTQKRKQKDGGSAETVRSEEDIPMSKKIIPSFPSQNKRLKNVKTPKSKTVLKNSAIKKVTKKVKTRIKKTKEMSNIDNSVSNETLKITDVAVIVDTAVGDRETASLNSEQTGEEQSPMITNTHSPTCKLQSLSNKTDGVIVCKDDATLENKENGTNRPKELNYSEIPKESSIAETNVAQIPPLESDFKNSDSSSSSETKQINKNEDSGKCDLSDKKIIVSSDAKYGEPSEEPKATSDNCKESNDQTISNKKNSSQNDIKSDLLSESETCQPISKQNTLIPNQSSLLSMNDSSPNVLIQAEKSNECKVNDSDHSKNSDQVTNSNNEHPHEVQPVINSNDESVGLVEVTPNKKDMTPIKSLILTAALKEENKKESIPQSSKDAGLNQAPEISGSSSAHIKDALKEENKKESIPQSSKDAGLNQAPEISGSSSEHIKDALKEENKKESIPQSSKDAGLNQAPEISGSSSAHIKDPVIFENDDADLTDSQLCATEWTMTGDLLLENAHSKKSDCCLAKFKRAERDGTQIVNELITELSRLNKLLLHFKREIDAAWKRGKGSSVTSQQNVIKKRAPVQTVLGQFR